jgi:hypothetical protein
MKNLFFSLLICNAIVGALLCVVVAVSFLLPFQLELFEPALLLLEEYPWMYPIGGVVIACIGLSTLIWSLKLLKIGRFVTIKKEGLVSIDEQLIEQQLKLFWKEKFPKQHIASAITLRNNKLHVMTRSSFEGISEAEREAFFQDMQKELQKNLHKAIGYDGDVSLSLLSR